MSELATFTITHKLEGMKAPGLPEGAGDRELTFTYKLDATDLEAASKAWYAHLVPWFGEDKAEEQRARVAKLEK